MSRTTEPTQITKGERIEWTKSLCDYSAADYDLEYRFRSSAGVGIDVNATADGRDFNCVIAAAASATFGATGKYRWQAWLTSKTDATNTFVIDQGESNVNAGFDTSSQAAVDQRSTAKKIVDAIDAAMLVSAGSDLIEYEIQTPAGSRRVKKSRDAAMAERKYYAAIVSRENAAERARNGGSLMKAVKVRL